MGNQLCGAVFLAVVSGLTGACGDSPAALLVDAGSVDGTVVADPTLLVLPGQITDEDGTTGLVAAKVCVLDHPEVACATTDQSGSYSISIPRALVAVDLAVNVTADRHLSFTGLVDKEVIPNLWISKIPLYTEASAIDLLQRQAGFEYPNANKGFVLLSVFRLIGGAVQGVSPVVSPAPASPPAYFAASGAVDRALTAMTSNGHVLLGELAPGKIEIAITGMPCAAITTSVDGWDTGKPATIAGQVAAGSLTRMSMFCQ